MLKILKTLENRFGRRSKPPCVLHHHIPKTAGTSFNGLLDGQYHPEEILPKRWLQSSDDDGSATGRQRYEEAFSRFRLIHVHSNLLPEVPEDWTVVTFLRPPVRRVVSLVCDWARLDDNDLAGLPAHNREIKIQARNAPIGDILSADSPLVRQHLCNGVCKSLLSRLYTNAAIDAMSDDELADAAEEVLHKRVDFVGDTTNFDEWLGVFTAEVYGRKFPARVDNRSGGASRFESLTTEERDQIETYNTADIALYERFVGHFGWTGAGRGKLPS